MAYIVKVELSEQEVEQLLQNAQRGHADAGGTNREQRAAYNRAVGKLQIALADAINPIQKRPYTHKTVTGRRRGRPRKNAVENEATPQEG